METPFRNRPRGINTRSLPGRPARAPSTLLYQEFRPRFSGRASASATQQGLPWYSRQAPQYSDPMAARSCIRSQQREQYHIP
jgi:hypothetical protein